MSPRLTEAQLNFFLHEGAVFYIQDRTFSSPEPHYFIILNHDPGAEECLLLVVSSSRVEKVRKRCQNLPTETLVEIAAGEYGPFSKDSIVSCNTIFQKSKQQLLEQLNNGGQQSHPISKDILKKLRAGVLASPMIARNIKDMLG